MQRVARLVAPGRMARQIASVAPLHVARQCGHAGGPCQRSAATAMTWPSLSRHAGWRDKANVLGPRRPLLPHPPFLSLTHPRPELVQGRRRPPPPPRSPPKSDFFRGKSTGNRSPPFPEDIAPNISSFNRVH